MDDPWKRLQTDQAKRKRAELLLRTAHWLHVQGAWAAGAAGALGIAALFGLSWWPGIITLAASWLLYCAGHFLTQEARALLGSCKPPR